MNNLKRYLARGGIGQDAELEESWVFCRFGKKVGANCVINDN